MRGRTRAQYDAQRAQDRRLTTLWNQGYLVDVIAQKLGFRHRSSVSHAASRLGLTPRRTRKETPATKARRVARQVRGEAAMMANLEKAVPKPVGPIPTIFRCICGGISRGSERHPQCVEAA